MTAALMLLSGVVKVIRGHADGSSVVAIGAAVVLVTLVWALPATVISKSGFRRVFKFTPWTEVAAVFPAGPGDPDVLIALRDGHKVSLVGVKQDHSAGILALAQQATGHAAA